MSITASEFMRAAPAPAALGGNTPWATRYAAELRGVVVEHSRHAARTLQTHLGPSELGTACDRQIVGKLTGEVPTNHVSDPWPSIVGTAVHVWLADAFREWNVRHGATRWLAEQRVTPHVGYSGTADLYDSQELAVVDHKVLGATSLAKVRSPAGPSLRYIVQLLLYGAGYRALGLPVRRIVLAAYPRTAATLDGLYVWERATGPEDDPLIDAVFALTDRRKALADKVSAGSLRLTDIATVPDSDECFFCSFYRPATAKDNGPGCPGTATAH
jgi:hypothetical protein